MNLQEKAIKQFQIEMKHLKSCQVILLRTPSHPGVKKNLANAKATLIHYNAYIERIPTIADKEITNLLLDELGVDENGKLT